jgi:hypothetical protein
MRWITNIRQELLLSAIALAPVTLGFLVLLAGCSGAGIQAVQDLVLLQEQLAAEYGESNIRVEIEDGNTLGVTFVSSSSNGFAGDRKAEQAREVASFVCENYASMDTVDEVWVAFEIRQDGTLVDATSSVTFTFEKSELECGDAM